MEFRISVRNLVEFILRSGDLTAGKGGLPDKEAMLKGGRIHRKIQKSKKTGYQSEVSLSFIRDYGEYSLKLEGRADGIMTNAAGEVTIDEIKGMYRDVSTLEEPIPVHLAQAKCYAYIYALDHDLQHIGVRMTYVNLDTENIRYLDSSYDKQDLQVWFENLLEAYHKWIDFSFHWRIKRNASMQDLQFPFPYRKGQRDVVGAVYRSILREKQLFIQAPTGVGKTMSTLFPAIRACGEEKAEKVFYLTARTITRTVAEEAFSILRKDGLSFKSVTLTAKEKLCILPEPDCDPVICPRAKGHFDRVNDAVFDLLTNCDCMDRDKILCQAEKYNVCPFEMMLDLAVWMDGIICDYNYVLDPRVRLKRFFADGAKTPFILLLDEAHNLVDRGRDMYSAIICKEDILKLKRQVKDKHTKLARLLEGLNRQLLEYKRSCDDYEVLQNLGSLPIRLLNVTGEMENCLEEEHDPKIRKEIQNLYFELLSFENIYELLDENYVIYSYHDGEGQFLIRLFCVNPAVNIQSCLDQVRSSVFFSATLLPVDYYKKLFSTRKDDYAIYASSSFLPEQKKVLIAGDVSSKYTRRNAAEFKKIADYIHVLTSPKQGCYMAYFPSYKMLSDVAAVYEDYYGSEENVTVLIQEQSMKEKDKEAFLENFSDERKDTLIAFCVMGGIFSEGIDLTGERLIGSIIVGTGIPMLSYERKILMDYYDKKGENGFDYAYRIPGMNKVLQSGGRVIRTAEDRGIIALLDERFLYRESLELFPREWHPYEIMKLSTAGKLAGQFWDKEEKDDLL